MEAYAPLTELTCLYVEYNIGQVTTDTYALSIGRFWDRNSRHYAELEKTREEE
ncbi:hypothetical protein KSC_076150 [Ktedonobacter sp. SOSP1-52]|nr:hypothetical protein KSC_076150 [Ktedonobacter sp. SOSP1-52]